MKKRITSFGMAVMVVVFLAACDSAPKKKNAGTDKGLIIHERIEWTNMWVEDTGVDSLPRLLLIGDSHVQQYYAFVKKELAGLVTFGRYTSSKCLGNPYLLEEIRLFLKQYPCDVIVFNNGLHGKAYPDSVYAAALPGIFRIFREEVPEARVIWVNTTPVRQGNDLASFAPFTEHVKVRNMLAAEYMKKHGIPIVDNWSLGYEHPEYYNPRGLHFNAQGKMAEARNVAEAVRAVLQQQ